MGVFHLHFAAALVPLHLPVRLTRSAVVPASRISPIRASSDLPRASSSDLSLTAPDEADCMAPMGVCLVPDTPEECAIEPGRTLVERIMAVPPVLLFAVGALIGVFGRPLWGLFVAAYHAYEAAAIARPLITKSATSGVAYLVGDIMAQVAVPRTNAEAGSRVLNQGRVVRSTAAGLDACSTFYPSPRVTATRLFAYGRPDFARAAAARMDCAAGAVRELRRRGLVIASKDFP